MDLGIQFRHDMRKRELLLKLMAGMVKLQAFNSFSANQGGF
jgi:hypothetical protein